MILNGIDLVYIPRIEKLKDNENFINKIFTADEIKYIKKCDYNSNTIAGLFAAKESLLKALNTGINNYSLKDIEIKHNEYGAPFIILHNEIKKNHEIKNINVSISHDGDYAIAAVLITI